MLVLKEKATVMMIKQIILFTTAGEHLIFHSIVIRQYMIGKKLSHFIFFIFIQVH